MQCIRASTSLGAIHEGRQPGLALQVSPTCCPVRCLLTFDLVEEEQCIVHYNVQGLEVGGFTCSMEKPMEPGGNATATEGSLISDMDTSAKCESLPCPIGHLLLVRLV